MTRTDRGRHHRSWRRADLERIEELAGTVPAREIRREMRLSKNQLDNARRLINAAGGNVSLRCYRHRLELCPACGCRRATLGRHGICEPCRRAAQLARIEARVAELLPLLPEAERATYAATESLRESRADPMPAAPDTSGMSRYEADRAEEEHDAEMERWLCRYLWRRVKAAQKRKERIEGKVRRRR